MILFFFFFCSRVPSVSTAVPNFPSSFAFSSNCLIFPARNVAPPLPRRSGTRQILQKLTDRDEIIPRRNLQGSSTSLHRESSLFLFSFLFYPLHGVESKFPIREESVTSGDCAAIGSFWIVGSALDATQCLISTGESADARRKLSPR